jgi:hypothetical protein
MCKNHMEASNVASITLSRTLESLIRRVSSTSLIRTFNTAVELEDFALIDEFHFGVILKKRLLVGLLSSVKETAIDGAAIVRGDRAIMQTVPIL